MKFRSSMSQKQTDALRREWTLLQKMGYAAQLTLLQKMARQDEIVNLLAQAGEPLPRVLMRRENPGDEDIGVARSES